MTLALLNDCIKAELAAVEQAFDAELANQLPCVTNLTRHLSRFRGKMLRPSLVLLAGKATGRMTDHHITIATVVELVHMSTLVHDDVLDEAELRRKGATINHLRGNEAAVMLGDYLISHAFNLCSSMQSQFASQVIGQTTNRVCEGELMQIDNRNNLALDEETYLQIINLKTASLCAACSLLGARYAGAAPAMIDQMEVYGRSLGTAFQIQDDILDIVGDPATVGKTLGSDIEKGKMTLPLIHFMRSAPAEHRQLLRSLMDYHQPDRADRIRNLILPSDSIDYARNRARQYVCRARAALAGLEDGPVKSLLDSTAEFATARPM